MEDSREWGVRVRLARRPGGRSVLFCGGEANVVVSKVMRSISHFFRCELRASLGKDVGGGRREKAEVIRDSVKPSSRCKNERAARLYNDLSVASAEVALDSKLSEPLTGADPGAFEDDENDDLDRK
jgi:hypothetical protein